MQSDPGFAARASVSGSDVGFDARHDAGRASAPMASRQKMVLAVERELSRLSYFPGEQDGKADAGLAGAIMAYQYDRGLPLTAKASDQLLEKLLSGADKPKASAGAPGVRGETAERLIAEIQGILSGEGYYRGAIDGHHNEAVAKAVRRFETERGLPVTGRVSGLLVQELSRVTGMRFTAPRG